MFRGDEQCPIYSAFSTDTKFTRTEDNHVIATCAFSRPFTSTLPEKITDLKLGQTLQYSAGFNVYPSVTGERVANATTARVMEYTVSDGATQLVVSAVILIQVSFL